MISIAILNYASDHNVVIIIAVMESNMVLNQINSNVQVFLEHNVIIITVVMQSNVDVRSDQ